MITAPTEGSSFATTHLLVTGTSEAGALVTAYDAGAVIGTARADSSGAWSIDDVNLDPYMRG